METYLAKKEKGSFKITKARFLEEPSQIKIIDHPTRIKIIKMLDKTAMFPGEMAKKLGLHEQKLYYHLKQLDNAGVVEVVETKNIRGTTAKKFKASELSFAFTLTDNWEDLNIAVPNVNASLERFINPFINNGKFSAKIVVGSPDPHGPFKASARDGHYAVDLALFFGKYSKSPEKSIVALDVDTGLEKGNLIVVGGPVTNMTAKELNKSLPVKFSESPPWGLISDKTHKEYTQENSGIIARIPHPNSPEHHILYLAGIRGVGTKSAVLAFITRHEELLKTFSKQKVWSAVVQGFDLDGDGKIDSVDILE